MTQTQSARIQERDLSVETDDEARIRAFGARLDAIRTRVEREIGSDDVAHIKKVRAFSRAMEITGRTLIHISLDPLTFSIGVGALWLHKQLEATEIGHSALHGAYDRVPGAEEFQAKDFDWRVPIDEESWLVGHNIRHHQYTNVAGRDPDLDFGSIRLTERTPHRPIHYAQVPITLLSAANFGAAMNLHFTGVEDALRAEPREPGALREAWRKAKRKYVPYYTREFLFYPALAGPMFAKVLFGNWLSEVMRDLYSAATIFCGHIGEDVADYPEGTRAGGRGNWYRMQVESANDFEVPLPISMLCGALDRQIEHHLFPRFPPNRLREIAPEVRQACLDHGVEYKTDTWPRTLGKVARRLFKLSFPSRADKSRAKSPATPVATPAATSPAAKPLRAAA
ncbi:MAG TPA: acyl-CoA desaturase [Kofleriaceae bacterium]|jgi:linoleoyl-CoA desaturase|nr:acyl-CoA desaturase [Kofleriaceae bacterium]